MAITTRTDDELNDIEKLIACWVEWMRADSGACAGGSGLIGSYSPRGGHGQGYVLVRNPQAERMDVLIARMGLLRGWLVRDLFFNRHLYGYSVRSLAIKHHMNRQRVERLLAEAEAWLDGMARGEGLIAPTS